MSEHKDYGMTGEQLERMYSPQGDGQHPSEDFSREDWREAVMLDETIAGYWNWVADQLDEWESEQ